MTLIDELRTLLARLALPNPLAALCEDSDCCFQVFRWQRLFEHKISPRIQCRSACGLAGAGGQSDHWQPARAGVAPKKREDLDAVEPGQTDVEHHEVERPVERARDRVFAVGCNSDNVTARLQELLVHL